MRPRRRRLSVAGATALALMAGGVAGPAQAAPASQTLVVLMGDHVARTAPNPDAGRIATVAGRRPLTGVRTVLPRLGGRRGGDGQAWSHVALPGRPNSGTGWIRTARTQRASTPWRISVTLVARRVTVRRLGSVVRRFKVVVGAPSTPTPRGRFFVEESLTLSAGSAGGPFALATSARSDVYQEFEGGPGQIALHGRNYLTDPLGTAASHGCVRLSTRAITWLAGRIGAGVPITVS